MKRILLTVIIALVTATGISAQSKIDEIVSKLKNDNNLDVIFTEKRDPKTKQILVQTVSINGNDKALAQKLWDTFEKEQENAVSVTRVRKQTFSLIFRSKNSKAEYILSRNNDFFRLNISRKNNSNRGSDDITSVTTDDMTYIFDNNMAINIERPDGIDHIEILQDPEFIQNLKNLENLKGLEDLENLKDLEGLKMLCPNSDITVTISNGKDVKTYRNWKSKSSSKSKSKSKSTSLNKRNNKRVTRTYTTSVSI